MILTGFCHPDERRDLRMTLVFLPESEDPSFRRDDKNIALLPSITISYLLTIHSSL
jgi:hypothetical protein